MSTATVKQEISAAKAKVAKMRNLYDGPKGHKRKVRKECKKLCKEAIATLSKHRMRCLELASAYEFLGYLELRYWDGKPGKRRQAKGHFLLEKGLILKGKIPFNGDNFQPVHLALDYYNLGQDYFGLERYDDAVRCYARAIKVFEKQPRDTVSKPAKPGSMNIWTGVYLKLMIHHQYAQALAKAGQLSRANFAYRKVFPEQMVEPLKSDKVLAMFAKAVEGLVEVRAAVRAKRKK